MTIRCPKCRMPALKEPGDLSDAGRIMRCASCETMWMARPVADAPIGASLIRRRPPVIDGQVVDATEPAPQEQTSAWVGLGSGFMSAVGRIRLAVLSLGIALGFAAAALVPPAFSAFSEDFEARATVTPAPDSVRASVTIPRYDSAFATVRKDEMPGSVSNANHVPALRIGDPVFNWRLEPSVLNLKPTPLRLANIGA